MRICFSLDNYDRGSGGAALAARELAGFLSGLGHEVHVLQPGRMARDYADGAVQVHARPLRSVRILHQHDRDTIAWNRIWRRVVDAFLDKYPTDLLLTQNRLLASSVASARAHGVPSVVWAHAYRIFCPTQFHHRDPLVQCSSRCDHCASGVFARAVRSNKQAYTEALTDASLVLANSRYMQRLVRHFTGVAAPVVYPTFDLPAWQQGGESRREGGLFIKPLGRKGLPLMLELARVQPQRQFIVVGKADREARRMLRALANVRLESWTEDMRPVYARSRVLLGPSVWPEPFGRVFVEAAGAGVPSVASNRGGIPEAVGNGGILVDAVEDVAAWVDALDQLDDAGVHERYARLAREHVATFAGTADTFLAAVKAATGLELGGDTQDAALSAGR